MGYYIFRREDIKLNKYVGENLSRVQNVNMRHNILSETILLYGNMVFLVQPFSWIFSKR